MYDITDLVNKILLYPHFWDKISQFFALWALYENKKHLSMRFFSQVVPRDVTLADFLTAMQNAHRTVSADDLANFESFTAKYGQHG